MSFLTLLQNASLVVHSVQSRFLADYPQSSSPAYAATCAAVALAGFYIFRAANSQKDRFKKDPTHSSVEGEATSNLLITIHVTICTLRTAPLIDDTNPPLVWFCQAEQTSFPFQRTRAHACSLMDGGPFRDMSTT